MNNGLKNLLIFTAGALCGALATYKFVKTKYERIAQEEIDSVKEVFGRRRDVSTGTTSEADTGEEDEEELKRMMDAILDENQYRGTQYGEGINFNKEVDNLGPYIIAPSEFGEKNKTDGDRYDLRTLTYYANGYLTDEFDGVVEDDEIEELIGHEALNDFGHYELNTVYVRNDDIETDFEILYDENNYEEDEDDDYEDEE